MSKIDAPKVNSKRGESLNLNNSQKSRNTFKVHASMDNIKKAEQNDTKMSKVTNIVN